MLALGLHMHAPEHLSFVTDGLQLRSDISAAIVGGNELGPAIFPSGFTLYIVRQREDRMWDGSSISIRRVRTRRLVIRG